MKRHQHSAAYLLMTVSLLSAILLAGCVPSDVYNQSAEVPANGWTSADTLIFDLHVADSVTVTDPVPIATPLRLSVTLRHTSAYPYPDALMQFYVHPLDSAGHPGPAIYRQRITVQLVDEAGRWTGGTWGDLIQSEYPVQPLVLTFPHPGSYRILMIPVDRPYPLTGLRNVGIALRRN